MPMSTGSILKVSLMMTVVLSASFTARAQDLESLVMPGPVIEGHADLERECSSCHKTFDKSAQRGLCLDCHEEISADVDQSSGFHGRHPDASASQCADCHSEHLGRDADIVGLDEGSFDHQFTDFELIGGHLEAACEDCHSPGSKRRDTPSTCFDCHEEDDVHEQTMGQSCGDCHSATDWTDVAFDHDTTGWPLIGKHAEAACDGCHADQTFRNTPTDCYGCHAEDDAHDGRSGTQCEQCHNPTDWLDTSFDHSRDTDFPLLGRHASLSCDDCHSEDPFSDDLQSTCVSCHLEDDSHDGLNGDRCETCHTPVDWAETSFDHDAETDFPLRGGHLQAACGDCHIDPVFEASPGTSCDSCHLEDEPHEGTLGSDCAACHSEVEWADPVFFDHDLTDFPLLGKHAENECDACHEDKAFASTASGCVDCHLEDDVHQGNFHESCAECHNPVAWDVWTFDHDLQTDFPLTGAHVNVACDDCHRTPLERIKAVDNSCRNCHRADDVHDGEFGFDCGRCHTADSFSEVRSLQ